MDFGTGCLKVTPAHDLNDYELGQKHGLQVIDILNDDGTLNEKAQILVGEDRFAARKKVAALLEADGYVVTTYTQFPSIAELVLMRADCFIIEEWMPQAPFPIYKRRKLSEWPIDCRNRCWS